MKILHYALGFPPYRSGGLTKFCMDLMIQQNKEGNTVALLWPGKMGFIDKKVTVKDRGCIEYGTCSIRSFEIINPLPISYDEGICDFAAFTRNANEDVYETLFDGFEPDIIHIHTLMGLHKSFLSVAKKKGIRLVFTAHDFFSICPKVTMFRHDAICSSIDSCSECGVCNATALAMKKIQVLQSPLYRRLKDSSVVKKLRKQHRAGYLSESTADDTAIPVGTTNDYKNLRAYYGSLLQLMDMIHYNSAVTKATYERYFDLPNNCVIGITHSNILDNRKIKSFSDEKLRIRYLGPNGGAKGFFFLKAALDKLWSEKQNFCLDVHFTLTEMSPYIKTHDRYTYSDLDAIFENTDVLVAPSIWYETFGFTVLEALSYGVPVIISGTVGAKDILADGAGIVIEDMTADKLCDAVRELNADKLRAMNKVIVERQNIMEIPEMSDLIERLCY